MKKFLGLFIKNFLRFLLKPLSFVPAICMMYLIYSFSAQDGASSSQLSLTVSQKIVAAADKLLHLELSESEQKEHVEKIHYFVRKTAHFTEYFVLAVTVAFPLYVYGLRGFLLIIIAGGFCFGFAVFDEFHQSFVAGRGPSKRDVLIDTCGALAGVIVTRIVCFLGRKTIFRGLSNPPKE